MFWCGGSESIERIHTHCKENPIYVLSEKKLRGLSPNLQIHVSVNDFYISTIGPPIFLLLLNYLLALKAGLHFSGFFIYMTLQDREQMTMSIVKLEYVFETEKSNT